eukprot:6467101-Amphidinium_carterae.5
MCAYVRGVCVVRKDGGKVQVVAFMQYCEHGKSAVHDSAVIEMCCILRQFAAGVRLRMEASVAMV